MPLVTYISFDGVHHEVDAPSGSTLMQAAVDNAVPGIDADCGGGCACATCHVFVEQGWLGKTGSPEPMESSMLQLAEGVTDSSRLSCQITLDDSHDGLVVRMPESQH